MKFENITIEPDSHEGVIAIAHTTFEKGSVLEGQYRILILGWYKSISDALAEYPNADIMTENTYRPMSISNLPPHGFDEADAGEHSRPYPHIVKCP